MANHVNTFVSFYDLNDAGKDKLKEILSRYKDDRLASVLDDFNEDEADFDWYVKHVGAKWAYIEEQGEDYISIVSAWSAPMSAIHSILWDINEVDPKFICSVSYTDEMPNFAGVVVFAGGEGDFDEIDSAEWDYDEIEQATIEQTGLDNEDEDFYINMWEVLDTMRDDVVEVAVRSLRSEV